MFSCRCLPYCLVLFLLLPVTPIFGGMGIQTQADCQSALSDRQGHDEICNNHRTYAEEKRFFNQFSFVSKGVQTLQPLETASEYKQTWEMFVDQVEKESPERLVTTSFDDYYPGVLKGFEGVSPVPALSRILKMFSIMITGDQTLWLLSYIAGQDRLAPEFDSQEIDASWQELIGLSDSRVLPPVSSHFDMGMLLPALPLRFPSLRVQSPFLAEQSWRHEGDGAHYQLQPGPVREGDEYLTASFFCYSRAVILVCPYKNKQKQTSTAFLGLVPPLLLVGLIRRVGLRSHGS